ncbi:SAM-dependent methyltransferase [Sphaerisporangium album]|uniref:SAM-dependent methyltransferase n=1 Tax=Sphaerisporangium album TaxID=509200 RepID=A0A367EPD9_9ACTN|nr:SAM-dependent methyltransferase [Sphaerisporangium album]RCG19070.1 SAM-dependent methyltransferase [Sphaerisporangium album]
MKGEQTPPSVRVPLDQGRSGSNRADGRRPKIDITTPHVARMYDYYLGGKDNYRSDRDAAEEVIAKFPEARQLALVNRHFLRRAVATLAGQMGIAQFLDLGSGFPTQENVHQVAQRINPAARVAYVDLEDVVLAHGQALLATDERTIMVQGDIREPRTILSSRDLQAHLNFDEPIAVLLIFVLHFIKDEEQPQEIIRDLMQEMPPGSCLVISHATPRDDLMQGVKAYDNASSPVSLRTEPVIRAFFDGLELVEPGLVPLALWRPGWPQSELPSKDLKLPALCGLGRKPA